MESLSNMTFQVLERLEALQSNHEALMQGMGDGPKDVKQIEILRNSVENIEMGLNEAQSMMTLAQQFKDLEKENKELKNKVRLLQRENAWLIDELDFTKHELQLADNMVQQFEEAKFNGKTPTQAFKCREFLAYMKKKKPKSSSTENVTEDGCCVQRNKAVPKSILMETIPDGSFSTLRAKSQSPISTVTETTTEESYYNKRSTPSRHILTRRLSGIINQRTSSRANSCFSRTSAYEMPAKLRSLNNLVKRYAAQKRFEVVIPLCKQALDDLEITTGHNHPDVATMLNILALVYRDQKKYKDAVSLLNDALAIRIKTLGETHLATVATLNSLAVLYCHCGNYREAERVSKRALEIRKRILGSNHLDVAKQYNRLAMICRSLRKYKDVEKYCLLALQIFESKFGLDDTNVVKIKHNLAVCYLRQGKCAEASIIQNQVRSRAHERDFGTITVRRSKSKSSRLKRSEP